MNRAFNLVNEPWIPCILSDGARRELGLRDTLVNAHEIREVRDDSPLVTIALYRLLLAILHRNFGPADMDAWGAVWSRRKFDAVALDDYFRSWKDSFHLSHPTRPFYQAAALDEAKPVCVWRLALVQANNATLFDHRTEHEMPAIPPAEAARLLVGYQAFAVGGGVSRPFNFMHSPITREGGFVAFLQGSSLFGSLWLNAGRYNQRDPFPSTGKDIPVWEKQSQPAPARSGRMPDGYLDYLTWQPRRVRLLPDQDEPLRFSRMLMLQGECLPAKFAAVEPMMAYRRDSQGQPRARSFQPGRSLWRDAPWFLQVSNDSRAPRSVVFLGDCLRRGLLPDCPPLQLGAMGMCSDRAKISFWRHEALPLPLPYLSDDELNAVLAETVAAAENGSSVLWRTGTALAERALEVPGGKSADKNEVASFRDSLSLDSRYWARVEQPFRHFMLSLPGNEDHREKCLDEWVRLIRETVKTVYREVVDSLDGSPRMMRAVYGDAGGKWGAERTLNYELARQLALGRDPEETAHE